MTEQPIRLRGKSRIRFKDLPFEPESTQVFFYDPNPRSKLSKEINEKVKTIKKHLGKEGFEFYCFNDIAKHMTDDMVRYLFPNWNGEPLKTVDNDLLKDYLAEEDRNIGPSFIRLFDSYNDIYSCYQLHSTKKFTLRRQLNFYRKAITYIRPSDWVEFSITENKQEYEAVYEKRFEDADSNFDELSMQLTEEVRQIVEKLHQENVGEFVLRCMVPVERRLSKVIITPKYEVLLPDFGNMPIKMSPMPKALFLLFLKHEEGIVFKNLVDYREELRAIYSKITNRTSPDVIDDNLDHVTDPSRNTINEKCSRIREAFIGRMDERLAKYYYVTGGRREAKRIILPRSYVEWQCEI